jgi:hypothetical protein
MKIDMHIHSKYSPDSKTEPSEIIKVAKKKRLEAIAITDHNTAKGWEDFIELGKKSGIKIILGEEIMIRDDQGFYEILGYFLNEEIVSNNLDEVIDEIREQDGIASVAHPFDPIKCQLKNAEKLIGKIDAVETFNSKVALKSYNKRAFEFAIKNHLGMTGGSDAHIAEHVGNAYTMADADDLETFKKKLLDRETTVHGKLLSTPARIKKLMRKFFK